MLLFSNRGTPCSRYESDEEPSTNLTNIDDIKRAAQREYPDESSENAFARYTIENLIRDIEFQKTGSRTLYIRLYYNKRQLRGELVTLFFNSDYRKAPRLNEVDRTSNLLLRSRRLLGLDPGDSWNHPISHPHHILKFPKEEEQGSLVPDAITCNLDRPLLYREPDYCVHYSEFIGPICQSDPWYHSQYSPQV
ncbi:hypothetical protein BHYA_0258g00070 [Botrytis hyacinthi]|uniref:Uncharacterized protein n=1 Tax=Botrytis hyacinthi TaxID=278943 RepID=A0A4Z1GB16_9HELO|nr:hypothetical protein BHYA_0258g00070 [Botrytis hyacinthi]